MYNYRTTLLLPGFINAYQRTVRKSDMKQRSWLYCGLVTTLNIFLNAVTGYRFIWLEGRVKGGGFRNWARRFQHTPTQFAQPVSEEEIVGLLESSEKVRLFGSGHSFNSGVRTDEVLVSLDRYSGFEPDVDLPDGQYRVRGGTRIRDAVALLLKEGRAFAALPSHDAQSIGGILSTDVHGTGRDWGFVSDSVAALRIIDGSGAIHDVEPEDDLFKAAIGGVGAVGIISQVVVKTVPRFRVRQEFSCRRSKRKKAS